MGFNTKECAWKHVTIKMLSRTLVGVLGFETSKSKEQDYLYAAGDDPIDIQPGNKGYPGNVKVLKYELDMMNDAARLAGYEDITEVPHEAIVITVLYKKRLNDPQRSVTATGIAFSEIKLSLEQNAKKSEVTLPFLSLKTIFA